MGKICEYCGQDMSVAETCTRGRELYFPVGGKRIASTFHFDEEDGRCHACGIKHGGLHHPGCDVEKCPRCGGQLISCGCLSGNGPYQEELTTDDFDAILFEIVNEHPASHLLTEVPDIYSDVAEYFNNEVLRRWDAKREEE